LDGLRDGLRSLGWVEGQNIVIEYGWADTPDRLPEKAAELVRKKVDLIFAPSSTQVEAARQATNTIPIVFATHADPVGVGHVASLARPGGNVTGVSMLMTELSAKELEILKEAVPLATRVGVLWDPTTPSHPEALKAVAAVAKKLRVQLVSMPVRSAQEFDSAFAAIAKAKAEALLVLVSPLTIAGRTQLAAAALKYLLPAIFGFAANADAGGLMSYGANYLVLHRRAADYVDRILKGANPADLPVQQAQEFELVINMKTARALGMKISQRLLVRADRVID
jgi:putative ABC transport system substrate-binding protein